MSGIQNNRTTSRYELYDNGALTCFLQYRMCNEEMWALSTVVTNNVSTAAAHTTMGNTGQANTGAANQGHSSDPAAVLIRDTLEDAYRRRIAVLPFCPLVRAFMFSHPLYLSLIPETWRGRFHPRRPSAEGAGYRTGKEIRGVSSTAHQGAVYRSRSTAERIRKEPVRKRAAQRAAADRRSRRDSLPDPAAADQQ